MRSTPIALRAFPADFGWSAAWIKAARAPDYVGPNGVRPRGERRSPLHALVA